MDILSEKWMINKYLEFVNDNNNVYKIKADAGIKIGVHGTHITVFSFFAMHSFICDVDFISNPVVLNEYYV